MTDKPNVSVGMPVYNGEEFIRPAIDSILNQTYTDYELIISDNASTDGTEEICRDYASRDSRVRYYRNKINIGASDNYNSVYRYARGEYFKWGSANDLCHPEFIEKCVDTLCTNPDVVLCYPEVKLFTDSLDDAQEYEDDLHLVQGSACERYIAFFEKVKLNNVMNGVMRTDSLKNTAMIKPYFSSDTALMAELIMRGKFYQVKNTYFYRRMDEKTATALKSKEDVLKHYFPNMNRLMLFQNWKLQSEYYAAIRRAPINDEDKRCIRKFFFRQLGWHRADLYKDLEMAVRKLLHVRFGLKK